MREFGRQKAEDRSQKSEIRNQNTELRTVNGERRTVNGFSMTGWPIAGRFPGGRPLRRRREMVLITAGNGCEGRSTRRQKTCLSPFSGVPSSGFGFS